MAIKHELGVLSDNQDYFHYSALWDTWSRVLVRGGLPQGFKKEISIELIPYGGYESLTARGTRLERVIKIYTPTKSEGDIYTHVLPQSVYDAMCGHLVMLDLIWFLDVDILRNVNLDKLNQHSTGETMYDTLKVDGIGDVNWLKKLKTFPDFFGLPEVIEEKVRTEKLRKLTEKFPNPHTRRFTFN